MFPKSITLVTLGVADLSRSRAFYAALGYREIDTYPDQEWESGLTTLLLEKPLA